MRQGSATNTKQLLSVETPVRDTSAATSLVLDVAKLDVSETSETVAESVAMQSPVSESSFPAPFSQLRHLNLAQNKVQFQLNISFELLHA